MDLETILTMIATIIAFVVCVIALVNHLKNK